jgi:diaminopimelate decarboxylase
MLFLGFYFIFYLAVKCNDDTNVIKLLAFLGAGFDCASKVISEKFFLKISFSL